MDYIGILFLVIIGLHFWTGYKKGFILNLFESLKTIGLFIVAFALCKLVGLSLLDGNLGTSIIESLEKTLLSLNEPAFSTAATLENKDFILEEVWHLVPLPTSLSAGCKELVRGYIDAGEGLSIGYYIARSLAYYVTISIAFLSILIIGSIIVKIVLFIFAKISPKQSTLSRVLGGVVGVVRGLILISVICYVIAIVYSFAPSTGLGEFIQSCLDSKVGIFAFFFNHNFLTYLINLVLKSL